jgi:hypothetical protein
MHTHTHAHAKSSYFHAGRERERERRRSRLPHLLATAHATPHKTTKTSIRVFSLSNDRPHTHIGPVAKQSRTARVRARHCTTPLQKDERVKNAIVTSTVTQKQKTKPLACRVSPRAHLSTDRFFLEALLYRCLNRTQLVRIRSPRQLACALTRAAQSAYGISHQSSERHALKI